MRSVGATVIGFCALLTICAGVAGATPGRVSRGAGVGPVFVSSPGLRTVPGFLGQPIYWAGRQDGVHYEFWRTLNGYVYIRYLPVGVQAGDPGTTYLIVATYPIRGAYDKVKNAAHGKVSAGPNGSIYWVRPNDPKSVLVAFPHVPYEIEVYDPDPKVARSIAANGLVRPVSS